MEQERTIEKLRATHAATCQAAMEEAKRLGRWDDKGPLARADRTAYWALVRALNKF
jgi:hypothetical protein